MRSSARTAVASSKSSTRASGSRRTAAFDDHGNDNNDDGHIIDIVKPIVQPVRVYGKAAKAKAARIMAPQDDHDDDDHDNNNDISGTDDDVPLIVKEKSKRVTRHRTSGGSNSKRVMVPSPEPAIPPRTSTSSSSSSSARRKKPIIDDDNDEQPLQQHEHHHHHDEKTVNLDTPPESTSGTSSSSTTGDRRKRKDHNSSSSNSMSSTTLTMSATMASSSSSTTIDLTASDDDIDVLSVSNKRARLVVSSSSTLSSSSSIESSSSRSITIRAPAYSLRDARTIGGHPPRATILPFFDIPTTEVDYELVQHMLRRERFYMCHSEYLMYQPDIDQSMRSVVCDWLMEVAREYAMGRETLHMAINYFDRFLAYHTHPTTNHETGVVTYECPIPASCERSSSSATVTARMISASSSRTTAVASIPCEKMKVDRANMQLVGVTCLFVAAKAEEIYPPTSKDMSITTDQAYNESQIDAMERKVLQTLNWYLQPQTPYSWLRLYCQMAAKCVEQDISRRRWLSNNDQHQHHDGSDDNTDGWTYHTIELILCVNMFTRMMELIDIFSLDIYSVRFLPSAIAAAVFTTGIVDTHRVLDEPMNDDDGMIVMVNHQGLTKVPHCNALDARHRLNDAIIKRVTGYDQDSLAPLLLPLRYFITSPWRGCMLSDDTSSFDVTWAERDLPTRQMHVPGALDILGKLPSHYHQHHLVAPSPLYDDNDAGEFEPLYRRSVPSATELSTDPVGSPTFLHVSSLADPPSMSLYHDDDHDHDHDDGVEASPVVVKKKRSGRRKSSSSRRTRHHDDDNHDTSSIDDESNEKSQRARVGHATSSTNNDNRRKGSSKRRSSSSRHHHDNDNNNDDNDRLNDELYDASEQQP